MAKNFSQTATLYESEEIFIARPAGLHAGVELTNL